MSELCHLLQKSAYRRRGTVDAIFDACRCHPLDCAGDLRSTSLTLATLTPSRKGANGGGRDTHSWQACEGSMRCPDRRTRTGTALARAIAACRARKIRFKCAISISTRFLSRDDCLNASVLGQRPGNVASFLVDTARDFADRRLWTALCLEQATTTVARFCPIEKCLPVVDQLARRREDLVRRADVHVTVLVERESSRLKVPSSRFDLSITGMCGAMSLSLTSQLRFAPEP